MPRAQSLFESANCQANRSTYSNPDTTMRTLGMISPSATTSDFLHRSQLSLDMTYRAGIDGTKGKADHKVDDSLADDTIIHSHSDMSTYSK